MGVAAAPASCGGCVLHSTTTSVWSPDGCSEAVTMRATVTLSAKRTRSLNLGLGCQAMRPNTASSNWSSNNTASAGVKLGSSTTSSLPDLTAGPQLSDTVRKN